MKLELGSGDRPTVGFTHLDIRGSAVGAIYGDATQPRTWDATGPFEEIRACHLLEHFSHRQTVPILKRWWSELEHDGRLYLEVPNLTGHIDHWHHTRDDVYLVVALFGEQDHSHNFHKTMFTTRTLLRSLDDSGFVGASVMDIGLVLCAEAWRP
jgi:predicted SAM-dependent methyltransferase